jgi:hypothetical protein
MSIVTLTAQSAADLIHDQGGHISEQRHVHEGEKGPGPGSRFAADDRQRRGALAAQRKEYQQRQRTGRFQVGMHRLP